MRSDRDKRSDSEREIDDFLSRFEDPADELSTDYSSYLNEKNTTRMTAAQTFYWKDVDSPDFSKKPESRKTPEKPADKPSVKAESTPEEKSETKKYFQL